MAYPAQAEAEMLLAEVSTQHRAEGKACASESMSEVLAPSSGPASTNMDLHPVKTHKLVKHSVLSLVLSVNLSI